ncbi:ATPase involved in DNA repair [Methanosarcina mazei SarPi]|uniref:ATPase involved in DNA repair n=1 Tax=Methanosarcina mazei SarPi TaxID=1434115 RepID=A0A0E3R8A1_METMZ|nr:ATPase involved in DNA repair [Methanosarcina mazei SarPi]
MKIKFLSLKLLPLVIIITGVIVSSGCADSSQAEPVNYKYHGDLYRSIFYPYAGLLKGDVIPGIGYQDHLPGMPEIKDSSRSMQDAAFMLARNIVKAEAISAKLEPGVQYLRDQGKDVNRLESLLEEYNSLVEEAKYYLELAVSSSGKDEGTAGKNEVSEDGSQVESSEKEYLIQSQKRMIQASMVLKDIFEEFKLLMPGNEELNETDRLSATGEGRVTLMGGFDIKLHLEEGEIAVMSPDSIIIIEGDYVLEIKESGPENIFIYHIQSADMEVSGRHKTLLLNGENITVEADGEGYASFFGNGTYSVENADGMKREGQWALDSFLKEIAPGRPGKTESRVPPIGVHDPETGIREKLMVRAGFTEKN